MSSQLLCLAEYVSLVCNLVVEISSLVLGGKRLDFIATGGYATVMAAGFTFGSALDSGSTFNGFIINGGSW